MLTNTHLLYYSLSPRLPFQVDVGCLQGKNVYLYTAHRWPPQSLKLGDHMESLEMFGNVFFFCGHCAGETRKYQ